jgi:hypothetical protein
VRPDGDLAAVPTLPAEWVAQASLRLATRFRSRAGITLETSRLVLSNAAAATGGLSESLQALKAAAPRLRSNAQRKNHLLMVMHNSLYGETPYSRV